MLVLVFANSTGLTEVWEKALDGFHMIESLTVNNWKVEATVKSKIEDALDFLEGRFGAVPADLRSNIETTTPLEVLKRWVGLVSKADSLAQFRQDAGL